MPAVALLVMIAATALPGFSQSNPDLQAFFQQNIGLSPDQIVAIRSGQAVAKALPSRTPAEVFLFGAVYIHAAPQSYLRFAAISTAFASSPTIWLSGCSAILLSFPT
jgi:hypothetical protein